MLRLPQRWRSAEDARLAVASQLKTRHFLRLHAFLLFCWTFGIAYIVSKGAFHLGIQTLSVRYVLSCVVGYLAFLLGVRIWLSYVDAANDNIASDLDGGDVVDAVDLTSDVASSAVDMVGGLGDGLDGAGEGCLPILLIGFAALAAVLLVWMMGPELLIEVAFEAVLAGSLVGAMRLGREPDWLWLALRKTIWIFLVVLCAMLLFGRYAQRHYPEAATTAQVVHLMLHGEAVGAGADKQ
jgi:hypothetical protein